MERVSPSFHPDGIDEYSAKAKGRGAASSYSAATIADLARNCRTIYNVRWDLIVIPGYINEEEAVKEDGASGRDKKKWSVLADEHFYLVTNVLVRNLAEQHMRDDGPISARNSRIRLGAVVSHTRGRISTSSCGNQVRKHVRYDFKFGSRVAAEVFRDWLKPDDSRALVEPLAQMDPGGICAAKGETGAVIAEKLCESGTAASLVDNIVPPSKFESFSLP